jgi:hypothetical protein
MQYDAAGSGSAACAMYGIGQHLRKPNQLSIPALSRADYSTKSFFKAVCKCVQALKGLALPRRVSKFGEIALAGSRRLRSTLAAAHVL